MAMMKVAVMQTMPMVIELGMVSERR